MVYILAAILVFGVLIAVHELGHFLAAKACRVRVNEFSIGMGPLLFQRTKGETEYSLRLLPIGGYCMMEGEEEESDDPAALENKNFFQKFFIFAAGAGMNFVTGLLIILLLFADAAAFYSPVISGLAPEFESRGEESLMEGDRFYAINGERIYLYSDVGLFLERSYGEPYDITVLRGGEKVILEDLDLKYGEVTSYSGEKYQGFGFYFGYEEANFLNRIGYSWYQAVDFVRLVRLSLVDLFTGGATINDLSGPVGIVSTMTEVGENAETVKDAIGDIAYLAALIAVNLSVMNLLPLPALDGGKILFLAVNSISMLLFKKKVPPKYENYIHTAGLVLLLGLMGVVCFNDIMKLF